MQKKKKDPQRNEKFIFQNPTDLKSYYTGHLFALSLA